jgi:hypothetical protein
MKRIALLACIATLMTACAQPKNIDGKTVEPYGVLSVWDERDACVQYQVSSGNVFWSVVLLETVVAPTILVGFSLYEPVAAKEGCVRK